MITNPYQVMLRPGGFFSIDMYIGDKFIGITFSNIRSIQSARKIAKELNIAFNNGIVIGQGLIE